MVRPNRSKELIPEILKEGPLTGIELYKKCRAKIGQLSEESYNEALHTLLKDKIINIEGYDPSKDTNRKRKQSFKSDGLIFYFVKEHDPIEIHKILDELNNGNHEEASKAYEKLKKLFIDRVKKLEILGLERWDELCEDEDISPEGDMAKEDYLIELGYNKPRKRDEWEFNQIFENIYLELLKNPKIKTELIIGLSDQDQSNIVLNDLILDITLEKLLILRRGRIF